MLQPAAVRGPRLAVTREEAGAAPAEPRAAGVWAASLLSQYALRSRVRKPCHRTWRAACPDRAAKRRVCDGVVMPWIELQGAVNVRDLGGLPTEDGRETVSGRLLRSDNLQELSSADVEKLVRDIGLTTVVDLRSTAEVTA